MKSRSICDSAFLRLMINTMMMVNLSLMLLNAHKFFVEKTCFIFVRPEDGLRLKLLSVYMIAI